MKKISISLIVIYSFIMINSCNQQNRKPNSLVIKIIETNDVHGAFFPFDFIENKASKTSLAQAFTYIEGERKKNEQEVLLLDNGDILQGQPSVYYSNFEKPDITNICAQIMNFMNYDAATVGNHDIEAGHAVYDKFNSELKCKWLAANAIDKKTGKPYFAPYSIIDRKGVKIAVLGLVTPGIPNWLPEKIWEGIEFDDMIETAKKWVEIIKITENPDLLIGLFHSGIDFNYGGQDSSSFKNENATKLIAQTVAGFDVVFGGHDHKLHNEILTNSAGEKVLLLDALHSAKALGIAKITLTFNQQTQKYDKTVTGEIVETAQFEPHKEFTAKFSNYFEEVKSYVNQPIGKFAHSITSRDAFFGDSEFCDLIHQIQLELTNADISLVAPLSFDTKIEEGDILVSDMFKLYRYENLLYTMQLTGKEIYDFLEYSYANWFATMQNENDHLLKFKTNGENEHLKLHGQFYNFDSAEGINYSVDITKPEGKRVKIVSFTNGKLFDMNKKYTVAVNSYRGNGGGGHLEKGANIPKAEIPSRIISSTEKDLRFFMMKWIEKKQFVEPKTNGNWKIIPENLHKKGKETDYKLLFEENEKTNEK